MHAGRARRDGVVGWLLRAATPASTALLAVGMALALLEPGARGTNALVTAGLLILMMTPLATLLAAMADEAAAGEWAFVAIGAVVIALLAGSLVVAFI